MIDRRNKSNTNSKLERRATSILCGADRITVTYSLSHGLFEYRIRIGRDVQLNLGYVSRVGGIANDQLRPCHCLNELRCI